VWARRRGRRCGAASQPAVYTRCGAARSGRACRWACATHVNHAPGLPLLHGTCRAQYNIGLAMQQHNGVHVVQSAHTCCHAMSRNLTVLNLSHTCAHSHSRRMGQTRQPTGWRLTSPTKHACPQARHATCNVSLCQCVSASPGLVRLRVRVRAAPRHMRHTSVHGVQPRGERADAAVTPCTPARRRARPSHSRLLEAQITGIGWGHG